MSTKKLFSNQSHRHRVWDSGVPWEVVQTLICLRTSGQAPQHYWDFSARQEILYKVLGGAWHIHGASNPLPHRDGSTELAQSSVAVISYFKHPLVVVHIPHFQWFEKGALFQIDDLSLVSAFFPRYTLARWLSAQISMPSTWDLALDNQEYKVMKPQRKEGKKKPKTKQKAPPQNNFYICPFPNYTVFLSSAV